MKNIIKADLYRVLNSTGTKIALLLTTVAAVLYYVLANMVSTGAIAKAQAGNITAFGDSMIIWLFASVVTGIIICQDFENKTIHGAIDYGRGKILAGYMIVYAILVVILLLPYTIGSIACIIAKVGMSGADSVSVSIYLDSVLKCIDGTLSLKLLLGYLAYAIIYIAQISICVPIAIKSRKPVVTAAFGFFAGMIVALISTVVSKVDILDKLFKLTPFAYSVKKINCDARYMDLFAGIGASIVFILVIWFISRMIIRRMEIK